MLDISMCLKKTLTWKTNLAMYSSAHNFLYRSQRRNHLSVQCQIHEPSVRSGAWIRRRWISPGGTETLLRETQSIFLRSSANDKFRDKKGTCLAIQSRQVPFLS